MDQSAHAATTSFMSTGNDGLDTILQGGLAPRRTYLLEGQPGTGKTTLALQWLLAGAAQGEQSLHVSLSETAEELRTTMASHDWQPNHDYFSIVELNVARESLEADAQYIMYHPSEVELGETIERVLSQIQAVKPSRVVIDSLSELQLLAQDPLRYRRQILALKQFFTEQNCTALFISQMPASDHQGGVHSLVHGVIALERLSLGFGATRRRLQVVKMRGRSFREGFHDFVIRRGGLEVFPRLIAADHRQSFERTQLASGKATLDDLLGGGLVRGTSTLFMGPTGTGKSSLASQYAAAALERGQGVAVYTFDEGRDLFLDRARSLQFDFGPHLESKRLSVHQIDAAELSSSEFTHRVRQAVEQHHAELVVIDSLNGFLSAMPEERFLLIHLHELLTYLAQCGVTTILTLTQPGIFGTEAQTPVNASYLADAIVLFRYFEARGAVRKAISVLKKRLGGHQQTIRELHISAQGIEISEPLEAFQGILTGVPLIQGEVQRIKDADGS
jgi:circadian clock protein KaiC